MIPRADVEQIQGERGVLKIEEGGFYFHSGDEDLPPGALKREGPLEFIGSHCSNTEIAITPVRYTGKR